jgi:GrpB-like predicted nucleotidyltransferase (UPF0157 family)
MIKQGYEVRGEYGVPGRKFFTKDNGDVRTYNVLTFQVGHPDIERLLNLRDYLIAHTEEAQAYSQLKEELAHRFPEDMQGYVDGKGPFIQEIYRKAKLWRTECHKLQTEHF